MAEEIKNGGREDQIGPESPGAPPATEQTAGSPPEQGPVGPAQSEPGDVVVNFDKTNESMDQDRAAEQAKVEGKEADTPAVEGELPEQPTPGADGQSVEDGPGLPADGTPTLKVNGKSTKVIDIGIGNRPSAVDDREPWEKTKEELDAEKRKPKRGKPPKAKTGPEVD